MKDNIYYEWVYEEYCGEDIIDPLFSETLKDANKNIQGQENYKIALVRNKGNSDNGLTDREYAYIDNGKLPCRFDGGSVIPKKFYKEVKNEI